MWFDKGELELFPDRPSSRVFLAAARVAPSRCKKLQHSVPRASAACLTCRSAPVSCPNCSARLGLVPTPNCVVDVCAQCEGIWLDAGELEALEGYGQPSAAAPAAAADTAGWEIPAPAVQEGRDAWEAPGHHGPLPHSHQRANALRPFECRHCSAALDAQSAWAHAGELYCGNCRPPEAVDGGADPYWLSDLISRVARQTLTALGLPRRRRGWFR